MARNPENDFGEARARLDRGEPLGALQALDKARQGFTKKNDADGLHHVLDLAQLVSGDEPRVSVARVNLEYATKQNLRQVTRTVALRSGQRWTDPYPDLEAPTEHTRMPITRGLKFWIAVGVAIGTVIVGAYVALIVFGVISAAHEKDLAVDFQNDTPDSVVLKWCTASDCSGFGDPIESHDVGSGLKAEIDFPHDDHIDNVVVYRGDTAAGCLPIEVSQVYKQLANKDFAVRVAVSQMTPCPGEPVTPSFP